VFDATLTRRLENLEASRAAVLIPLDATIMRRLENLEASRPAALIPLRPRPRGGWRRAKLRALYEGRWRPPRLEREPSRLRLAAIAWRLPP
jgi:hypothetical protein